MDNNRPAQSDSNLQSDSYSRTHGCSDPIFIIGYMGCGKTTFGHALATATGRQFIDLDFYIEQRFHRSITEIFASDGESHFRKLERAMLHEVADFENSIIACGGGTPCFFDNIDYMLERGTVVFLEASTERIVERITINNARRPLMAGKTKGEIRETVDKGLSSRLNYYRKAHIIHCGDNLEDRNQISETISAFLKQHFPVGT
ncbi:MAG: shikimate kinase [Bacteroidales bacterium]|nr:shikimate kinase [Bacteroidales bacterium]